jgi:hypothetical protein
MARLASIAWTPKVTLRSMSHRWSAEVKGHVFPKPGDRRSTGSDFKMSDVTTGNDVATSATPTLNNSNPKTSNGYSVKHPPSSPMKRLSPQQHPSNSRFLVPQQLPEAKSLLPPHLVNTLLPHPDLCDSQENLLPVASPKDKKHRKRISERKSLENQNDVSRLYWYD